jgi:hypothetical protein
MWAEIKKAINSRLGKKNFKSLDEIIEYKSYENYYNTMRDFLYTYGDGNGKMKVIPKGRSEISDGEFLKDSSLSVIVIPLGLKKIGGAAFQGTSLRNLIIPEGVTDIGSQIVYAYHRLDEIRIPKSIIKIEEDAFNLAVGNMYLPFSEGEIEGAPWGFSGNVYYDCD